MRKKRAEWLELEDKDQIYYLLAERRGTSITEERLAGRQDGFDQLLEEWLVAPEQDDQSTADEIWARDPRFQEALDQF